MKTVKALTETDTQKIAATLAPLLQPGDIVALWGTLGVGKTAFSRYLIRHMTQTAQDVPSPTFTLLQVYDTDAFPIYHFDLYRLDKPTDVYELGIEDAFIDAVSLIEWPDKMGRLLPKANRLDIRIDVDGTTRLFTFDSADASWQKRLNTWQVTI